MTTPNQRRFTRLTLEHTSVGVVDVESGVEFTAEGKDLSGEGLRFHAPMEPSLGADMQVLLRGSDPRLSPLRATFRVLRVTKAPSGWDVAGTLHTL
ncbi:MAG: PilZ domain-containing protein [Myxococcaceae bacterium]|jgi:hypothetical protein|nr:PilZ domain-containing protein [Myxococcaceae bacterium]